jgi:hypothetical protein
MGSDCPEIPSFYSINEINNVTKYNALQKVQKSIGKIYYQQSDSGFSKYCSCTLVSNNAVIFPYHCSFVYLLNKNGKMKRIIIDLLKFTVEFDKAKYKIKNILEINKNLDYVLAELNEKIENYKRQKICLRPVSAGTELIIIQYPYGKEKKWSKGTATYEGTEITEDGKGTYVLTTRS